LAYPALQGARPLGERWLIVTWSRHAHNRSRRGTVS